MAVIPVAGMVSQRGAVANGAVSVNQPGCRRRRQKAAMYAPAFQREYNGTRTRKPEEVAQALLL